MVGEWWVLDVGVAVDEDLRDLVSRRDVSSGCIERWNGSGA